MCRAVSGFSGARLREARLEQGLSQARLAEMIGVSLRNVTRWESGATQPRAETLLRIAQVLGKPLPFFFDDVELVA